MKNKSIILALIMVLGLVSLFTFSSHAIEDPDYTETIPAGGKLYFNIELDEGDILTIEFEVIAGGNKDIDLYIENSNGDKIEDYGRLIAGTINFDAPYNDVFSVYFSNSFSTFTSKTVEISFDISYATSITIYSPRSTDIFENGCNDIQWTTTGSISSVRIELYAGSSFLEVISPQTYNDGSYSWCLSSSDTYDGSNYRIKISDYYDASVYVFSDYFTIEIEQTNDSWGNTYFEQNLWILLLIILIPTIVVLAIAIIFIHKHRKKVPKEVIIKTEEKPRIQETPKIIYCSSCGAKIMDTTAEFCSKCGSPLK